MAKKSKSKTAASLIQPKGENHALSAAHSETPMPTAISPYRSEVLDKLFSHDIDTVLAEKLLFETRWNEYRGRWRHHYKIMKRSGIRIVFDQTTGLAWQQSGSSGPLTYRDAKTYLRSLNDKRFAGYKDWRLPTLSEAMFLMEPLRRGALYIAPVFDHTQQWIWTMDESSTGVRWVVTFRTGYCYVPIDRSYYVRAVRGEYWFPSDFLSELDDNLLPEGGARFTIGL